MCAVMTNTVCLGVGRQRRHGAHGPGAAQSGRGVWWSTRWDGGPTPAGSWRPPARGWSTASSATASIPATSLALEEGYLAALGLGTAEGERRLRLRAGPAIDPEKKGRRKKNMNKKKLSVTILALSLYQMGMVGISPLCKSSPPLPGRLGAGGAAGFHVPQPDDGGGGSCCGGGLAAAGAEKARPAGHRPCGVGAPARGDAAVRLAGACSSGPGFGAGRWAVRARGQTACWWTLQPRGRGRSRAAEHLRERRRRAALLVCGAAGRGRLEPGVPGLPLWGAVGLVLGFRYCRGTK